jgi:hypothetical protein
LYNVLLRGRQDVVARDGQAVSLTFQVQPGATVGGFTGITFTSGSQQVLGADYSDITSQSGFTGGGVNVIPEPSSLLVLGLVLPALVLLRAKSWLRLFPKRAML